MAQPAVAGETVVLVSNEYVPYVNTSARTQGFLSEVVIAAFAEVGVEARVEFRPWRRCAMLVETGEVLGAFPYAVTERREEYAWFSDQIWICRNVFFYLKGRMADFDYTRLEDLRNMRIAGTSGNYYEDIFKEARLKVDYAPGEASGIRKIWEMRSDLFAEDELVGWNLISQLFPGRKSMFGSTPTPWNMNSQHVMISKKYPESEALMKRFNHGLENIRINGVYAGILSRYKKE
nr:transporter substrate-binding domain-containing protein [uncultured Pseudodesulfovibrio sp.]